MSTPKTAENPSGSSLSNLICFATALEDHKVHGKFVTSGSAPHLSLDLAAVLEWSPRAVEEPGPEILMQSSGVSVVELGVASQMESWRSGESIIVCKCTSATAVLLASRGTNF